MDEVVALFVLVRKAILTSELNMWCVDVNFDPRPLTTEQKDHHAADEPSFMSRIICGEKSLINGYDSS